MDGWRDSCRQLAFVQFQLMSPSRGQVWNDFAWQLNDITYLWQKQGCLQCRQGNIYRSIRHPSPVSLLPARGVEKGIQSSIIPSCICIGGNSGVVYFCFCFFVPNDRGTFIHLFCKILCCRRCVTLHDLIKRCRQVQCRHTCISTAACISFKVPCTVQCVLSMMDGRGRVRCPVFYFTRKPLPRPLVASRVCLQCKETEKNIQTSQCFVLSPPVAL